MHGLHLLFQEGVNILDSCTAVVRCELNCCAMSNALVALLDGRLIGCPI